MLHCHVDSTNDLLSDGFFLFVFYNFKHSGALTSGRKARPFGRKTNE
jgi:hypothetical protein